MSVYLIEDLLDKSEINPITWGGHRSDFTYSYIDTRR